MIIQQIYIYGWIHLFRHGYMKHMMVPSILILCWTSGLYAFLEYKYAICTQ